MIMKKKKKGLCRKIKFKVKRKYKNAWNFWQFSCNNSCTEGFQEYYIQNIFHQIVQLYVHFQVQPGFAEQVFSHSKLQLHVSICALYMKLPLLFAVLAKNIHCRCHWEKFSWVCFGMDQIIA